jgi:carbonic anhydrase/acetyltransferase-like protein (isoleucine patch superfamily)
LECTIAVYASFSITQAKKYFIVKSVGYVAQALEKTLCTVKNAILVSEQSTLLRTSAIQMLCVVIALAVSNAYIRV